MKNILISGLILGSLLSPTFAAAQVVEPVTSTELQAQLDTLKQQLIELLLAQIAQLQAQISELQAQQTTQQTQLNEVVQNTTQVVGGTDVVAVAPEIILSPLNCTSRGGVMTITTTDEDYKYGEFRVTVGGPFGITWPQKQKDKEIVFTTNGTYSYVSNLYRGGGMSSDGTYTGELVATKSGEVTVNCN